MSFRDSVKTHKGKIIVIGTALLALAVNAIAGDPVGGAFQDLLNAVLGAPVAP